MRVIVNALQQYDADLLDDYDLLVGVDEVGRGCLAGPVAAAACVLNRDFFTFEAALQLTAVINDSKKLSAAKRGELMPVLASLQAKQLVDYRVGWSSVSEIADLNILGATRLAMQRAIDALLGSESHEAKVSIRGFDGKGGFYLQKRQWLIHVDGPPLKPFPYPHRSVIQGDGRSLSIAIASIVAKVERDAYMEAMDSQFPAYGFASNKGYGTQLHRTALKEVGPISAHRALFIRNI